MGANAWVCPLERNPLLRSGGNPVYGQWPFALVSPTADLSLGPSGGHRTAQDSRWVKDKEYDLAAENGPMEDGSTGIGFVAFVCYVPLDC